MANASHYRDLCRAECPKTKSADQRTAYEAMFKQMDTMLAALGPKVDGLDPQRFNDLRRAIAFMQIKADMAASERDFAMVAGPNGRMWVIFKDGRQVLLEGEQTKEEVARKTGLNPEQAGFMLFIKNRAKGGGRFEPGAYYMFTELSYMQASSEHSSVRGTINGGGDFI